MSYILEALRRSQAERERGQVPGLHAQPLTAEAPAGPRRAGPGPMWLLAGGALVLLLGLALWWARPGPAVVVVPAPVAAPAPAPAALPQVVSAPAAPVVVPAPAAASPPVTLSAPAPAPAPAPAAPPVVVAAPAPAATPAAPPRPVPLAQLSAEQRAALPPLVVSGSIWSDSAASRFVMINGQVVREGEAAAPGVVLERIGPKSAVLRWRELRIELPL